MPNVAARAQADALNTTGIDARTGEHRPWRSPSTSHELEPPAPRSSLPTESREPAADTCVEAEDRAAADIFSGDILASLTCRRLFRLRLGENFHESGEKHFPFFGGERVPTGRRGVVLHKFLECHPQLGRGLAERAVWFGGYGLISVGGKPFGRGLKSDPARHFGRKIDFAPLGMPRRGVELIDLAEKRVDEFGDPLVPRGILRPSIGDKQCRFAMVGTEVPSAIRFG